MKFKKCLSILLCAALAFSIFVLPAAADTSSDFYIVDGTLELYYGSGGMVTIPDGVTSIGSYVFTDNANVTGVVIPGTVSSIGSGAFANCTNLSAVTFQGSVSVIGDYAFENCTALNNFALPSGLASIGNSAFEGCASVAGFSIPATVTGHWHIGLQRLHRHQKHSHSQ